MKTIKNNLMKLEGTAKAYYIVALMASPFLLFGAILGILNMIF